MSTMQFPTSPIVCGLILHLIFNRFEHTHLTLLKYLLFILPFVAAYGPYRTSFLVAYTGTYSTLLTSIIVYRLSPFHPLAKYPGPILAKCTKFWGLYHMTTGKFYLKFQELHRQYGPAIRVGPNEISLCDIDAIQPVLGVKGMAKGPLFAGRTTPEDDLPALICITDTEVHLQRRKVWNKALNVSNIKSYEPIIRMRLDQLLEALRRETKNGAVVDLARWLSFFTYDFMGDMAFGAGFELMKKGDADGLWNLLVEGLRVQSYTQHIPWATFILYKIPGAKETAAKLTNFIVNLANNRVKGGKKVSDINDLSSYLLNEKEDSSVHLTPKEYMADAFLSVVAGADTVATTLSCTFFYLISEEVTFLRLRKEIEEYYPVDQGREPMDDTSKLANMPFLNAVINETLRLHPPVPTCIQRQPEEGTMIGRTIFVPKGTAVYIPPYTLQRDSRYFSPDPEKFNPDRWLPNVKGFNTNQNAYIPFSIGPMNCVGKLLGQLELRVVLATLVQRFDFKFKDGWNKSNWEMHLEDFFLFEKGELPVKVVYAGDSTV